MDIQKTVLEIAALSDLFKGLMSNEDACFLILMCILYKRSLNINGDILFVPEYKKPEISFFLHLKKSCKANLSDEVFEKLQELINKIDSIEGLCSRLQKLDLSEAAVPDTFFLSICYKSCDLILKYDSQNPFYVSYNILQFMQSMCVDSFLKTSPSKDFNIREPFPSCGVFGLGLAKELVKLRKDINVSIVYDESNVKYKLINDILKALSFNPINYQSSTNKYDFIVFILPYGRISNSVQDSENEMIAVQNSLKKNNGISIGLISASSFSIYRDIKANIYVKDVYLLPPSLFWGANQLPRLIVRTQRKKPIEDTITVIDLDHDNYLGRAKNNFSTPEKYIKKNVYTNKFCLPSKNILQKYILQREEAFDFIDKWKRRFYPFIKSDDAL